MKISLVRILTLAALSFGACALSAAEPPSEPPENWLSRHLPANVKVHADIPYGSGGHERQSLDIYLPGATQDTGPHPLVVFVHGGGWMVGSKADVPRSLGKLLDHGYALASVDYRLSQHAQFPAQLEDCKAAVRWLRAHAAEFALDPARVAVIGPSAGGHLVTMLGVTGHTRDFDVGENLDAPSRVQAVVDYFGPTDFTQMQAHLLPNAPFQHKGPQSAEARLIGGAVEDPANRAAVETANPIHWLKADAPPFLIFHGDEDPVVPYHQSELLDAALRQAGVPVQFVTVRGGQHGYLFPSDTLADRVVVFLEAVLKARSGESGITTSRAEVAAEPKP